MVCNEGMKTINFVKVPGNVPLFMNYTNGLAEQCVLGEGEGRMQRPAIGEVKLGGKQHPMDNILPLFPSDFYATK